MPSSARCIRSRAPITSASTRPGVRSERCISRCLTQRHAGRLRRGARSSMRRPASSSGCTWRRPGAEMDFRSDWWLARGGGAGAGRQAARARNRHPAAGGAGTLSRRGASTDSAVRRIPGPPRDQWVLGGGVIGRGLSPLSGIEGRASVRMKGISGVKPDLRRTPAWVKGRVPGPPSPSQNLAAGTGKHRPALLSPPPGISGIDVDFTVPFPVRHARPLDG